MEQNYSENLRINNLNEDAFMMQQVVGDDYELLVVDIMLKNAFSYEN